LSGVLRLTACGLTTRGEFAFMKPSHLGLLFGLLLVGGNGAAGPPKLDRTIRKEPAYKTTPVYGLLVLGKEAKTRVWIVRDHDRLYVDRNANGDLTEAGEAVALAEEGGGSVTFRVPDLTDPHAGRVYKNLEVRVFLPSKKRGQEESWSLELDVEDGCRPVGVLAPRERPRDAPAVHFGGPLGLDLAGGLKLVRGGPPGELYVGISLRSPGFTPAALLHGKSVPKDVHPVAEITFPARVRDARPITIKVPLTQRC
jgi:hypothetical protein